MTSGFWDSMTMTSFFSTTFVSTFCCSLVSSVPLSFAFLRIRWTAAITSLCCARKALPRSVVHWMSSREPLDELGYRGHRLDARVPRLLRDRVGQGLVLELRVLGEPLLQLDDLERIGGGDEGLGQQLDRDRARSAPPAHRAGRVCAERYPRLPQPWLSGRNPSPRRRGRGLLGRVLGDGGRRAGQQVPRTGGAKQRPPHVREQAEVPRCHHGRKLIVRPKGGDQGSNLGIEDGGAAGPKSRKTDGADGNGSATASRSCS